MVLALAAPITGLSSCNFHDGMACPSGDCEDNYNNNGGQNWIEGQVYSGRVTAQPSERTLIPVSMDAGGMLIASADGGLWINYLTYANYGADQYVVVSVLIADVRQDQYGEIKYYCRIVSAQIMQQ